MAELLTGMNIGYMNFNYRRGYGADSVLQSNGSVCISPCVQYDTIHIESGLLNNIYDFPFNIRLEIAQFHIGIFFTKFSQILFKCNASIYRRFTLAEGVEILEVSLTDLQRFAAGLHDIGIHARSQARIISGIKSFFHFLIIADYIEADPSELLEGPKIGFKLPEVLTVEEIDRIISTIDLSKNEGQRNRAILETLYSCGLRVSELTGLKLSDLYFDEGFIKVEGKGSKQRLVPISPKAIQAIKLYF